MTVDPKHETFTLWAKDQGVVLNGIESAEIPGKGVGIVATRRLKKGEVLLSIPASALITHDTQFVREAGLARGTVYGDVAAALTMNHENEQRWYKVWQEVWPTRQDLETNMPLFWNIEEQDLLTPAGKALLNHQREKYESDFQHIRTKIPQDLRDCYKYYWLIVNTRCFFWEYFKRARDEARKGKKLPRDECLALVPWGDYFNHADQGCAVTENEIGATIICNRVYNEGEEVVVSYGAHSNDYLLVECLSPESTREESFTETHFFTDGFVLDTNKHDCTTVDHIILDMLTPTQKNLLEEHNYLGDYYMTSAGFCYRSQVAMRAMVTSNKRMQEFLADEYDGQREVAKMNARCREICGLLRQDIERGIRSSEADDSETSSYARQSLKKRWAQLAVMLEQAETQTYT